MKKAEADKLRKQAEAKIEHGLEMLRLGNGDLAQEAWKKRAASIRTAFRPTFSWESSTVRLPTTIARRSSTSSSA